MADITLNAFGVVAILEDDETTKVLEGLDKLGGSGGILTKAGAGAGLAPDLVEAVATVLTAYFKAQAWLIRQTNKGNGIYLTLPYPAIWFGQLYLIIPGTRPLGPAGWSDLDGGELRTEDGSDRLRFEIARGAVDPKVVGFELRLAGNVTWKKELHLPNGLPSVVVAERKNGSGSGQIAATKLASVPYLQLKKAKGFGIMTPVLTLRELSGLAPGDLVRFVWYAGG